MCLTWGFISGLSPQKGLLAHDSQACLVNYTCLPPFPSPVTDSEINWHMIQTETRSFSETLNVDVRVKLLQEEENKPKAVTLFPTNSTPIFHFQSQVH